MQIVHTPRFPTTCAFHFSGVVQMMQSLFTVSLSAFRDRAFPWAAALCVSVLGMSSPVLADQLRFQASGEDLATGGFVAPRLTKDGWALSFSHIQVTLGEVVAHQASPAFEPQAGGEITSQAQVALPGVVTIDLVTQADGDDMVSVAELPAPAGHYNALAWSMLPALDGKHAGDSLVLIGEAEKDGTRVAFHIASRDAVHHRCGEYVGDERKGFVTAGAPGEVEITLHLDHLFGRADKPADDPMNLDALGFAPFVGGGERQAFSLNGLHLGHVGEGHCAVALVDD